MLTMHFMENLRLFTKIITCISLRESSVIYTGEELSELMTANLLEQAGVSSYSDETDSCNDADEKLTQRGRKSLGHGGFNGRSDSQHPLQKKRAVLLDPGILTST